MEVLGRYASSSITTLPISPRSAVELLRSGSERILDPLDNPVEAEETYCGIRLLDYVLSVDRIGIVAGERFCRDVLASIGVFDAIDD